MNDRKSDSEIVSKIGQTMAKERQTMNLCKAVELSEEHRAFQAAAALAQRIRDEAARQEYDLANALTCGVCAKEFGLYHEGGAL